MSRNVLDNECTISIWDSNSKERHLVINSKFIEGMFPHEYAIILRVLNELEVETVNCYVEAENLQPTKITSDSVP